MSCHPPLGIPCGREAEAAARIDADFLPPTDEPAALCELHVGVLRAAGFRLHLLSGFERDVALGTVRPAVVGGLPIEDMSPGELQELFGR